jgi:hypothetical protein
MEYKYINNEGVEEKVLPENWAWSVMYKNGTELKQFDNLGGFHRVGEIEQENISVFTLYKFDNPSKKIDIIFREGMKIIHKYRNVFLRIGKPDEESFRIYIFGYKFGEHYHLNYIFNDDIVLQSNNENEDLTRFFN